MKTAFKWIFGVFAAVILIGGIVLLSVTLNEYRPEEKEDLTIVGEAKKTLAEGDKLRLLTLNIGYGCLSADQDFFMDGGETVRPSSKKIVSNNMEGILSTVKEADADVILLQEIDRDSKRSYGIDEVSMMADEFSDMSSVFASDFLCKSIPYPVDDMIGRVDSGIMTLNSYKAVSATRYSLPSLYTWPVRACQIKNCLSVERMKLDGSRNELVIVNLHLGAYAEERTKWDQIRVLARLFSKECEKGNYVIAGGDFNETFSNIDISAYPAFKTENYAVGILDDSLFPAGCTFAMDSSLPTCRLLDEPYTGGEDTQYYVIDGFILSPNISLSYVKTLDYDFQNTDHNPVVVEIELGR